MGDRFGGNDVISISYNLAYIMCIADNIIELRHGIKEISVICTHGVFVDSALDRLQDVPQISEIITSDTVFIPPEKRIAKLQIRSVAWIFGEAIRRNYLRKSIGELFVYGNDAPPPSVASG